jgi:cell division protein FtsN
LRPYTPPSYGDTAGEPRLPPTAQPRGGYRRPTDEEDYYDDTRRGRATGRGRAPETEDDLDEVFEDDAPPPKARRRASAQDYGRAYREYEDEFGDAEGRRSRGPLMVLAGLVVLAGLIGGGIWYYNNFYKSKAGVVTNQGDVPTITAPADPAKVDPPAAEQPAAGDAAPPTQNKQFYDRILGEQTIEGGQMVPTEEVPVTTGTTDPAPTEAAPADPAAKGAATPADQGTDALPLPLPPPTEGSDTQGALPPPKSDAQTADASEKVIPTAAPPAEEAMAPVPGEAAPPPAPGESDSAPAISATGDPAATPATPDPADTATAATEETPEAAKPVVKLKKRKAASAKSKRRMKGTNEEQTVALGNKPVVLVPPSAATGDVPASETGTDAPIATDAQPRSRSFFGGGRLAKTGKGAENALPGTTEGAVRTNFKAGTRSAPATAASEPEQVASIADDTAAAEPQPRATASGRYVVQLGSFRTEQEARAEASRLRSKSAALNGVSTNVVRATVFGSSRYRVMTSPVADRATGQRICEQLLSANEPNCSVKTQ